LQGLERGKPPEPEPTVAMKKERPRVGELLLSHKLINETELDKCVDLQHELAAKGEYVRLGELLVRQGRIARRDLAEILELQSITEGATPNQPQATLKTDQRQRALGAISKLKSLVGTDRLEECLALLAEVREQAEHGPTA